MAGMVVVVVKVLVYMMGYHKQEQGKHPDQVHHIATYHNHLIYHLLPLIDLSHYRN